MRFQSEKSRNAYLVPVKQETVYQSPYDFFVILFVLFEGFKFFYPFLAYSLFNLNLLLLIEMIMASMIGWDYARFLDGTENFNETIP
jgi:hypothetical protein